MALKEFSPVVRTKNKIRMITQNLRFRYHIFEARRVISESERVIRDSGVNPAAVDLLTNDPKVLDVIRLKDERQLLIDQGFSPKSQEVTDLESKTDEARRKLGFAQWIALARIQNRRFEEEFINKRSKKISKPSSSSKL